MKNFFLNILATVIAGAIVANVAALWQINQRVTSIETTLRLMQKPTVANNTP